MKKSSFMLAAGQRYEDMVRLPLERGADIDHFNREGLDPNLERGHGSVTEILKT